MSYRSRSIVGPAVVMLVVMLALGSVAAACGQKSGVAGTGGEESSGGGGGSSSGGDGGGGTSAHEADSNDTSGVTDSEIVIGVHAPVTGASPIPQTSFDTGKDIYWNFLAESNPEALGGRKVRVVFRDDEFNPNNAVRVCREMVEQEGAFILVGGGGADQITACAQYANENNIPYFSAGVNEDGLSDLSTYFALSATYAQQSPLIAQLMVDQGFEKVGVVVSDTPTFKDAHDSFVAAADDAGLDVVVDDFINKTASEAEALSEIQSLKDAGAEAVFLVSSPLVFLALANAAQGQSYDPAFFGPGITSGLNAVMSFGCPAVNGGQFLSPFPGLDVINDLDPDYETAYAQFGGGAEADDIGLALWGLNKTLALMFEAAGNDLGRAALMNTIEGGEPFDSGVYPSVILAADNHFGGTGAQVLEADCSGGQYVTEEQFVPLPEGS